ncbi:hypothetical protein FA95DRAFT_822732 [Auriscalpium vulgare]|uniref:Uncharacterized protein n=1 Tax=Auriscalpium vulgare TaxID=40419 RepID=A0ACB8S0S7_9AGAM|nr:hypothetical protein FA95DRAFT_822732 [Auriscalpium vulgare]
MPRSAFGTLCTWHNPVPCEADMIAHLYSTAIISTALEARAIEDLGPQHQTHLLPFDHTHHSHPRRRQSHASAGPGQDDATAIRRVTHGPVVGFFGQGCVDRAGATRSATTTFRAIHRTSRMNYRGRYYWNRRPR